MAYVNSCQEPALQLQISLCCHGWGAELALGGGPGRIGMLRDNPEFNKRVADLAALGVPVCLATSVRWSLHCCPRITVNSILPGPTKSRGVGEFIETLAKADGKSFGEAEQEFFEKVRPASLLKRFASPQEVASLVTYIASPLASATTGAAIRVDGGVIKSAF